MRNIEIKDFKVSGTVHRLYFNMDGQELQFVHDAGVKLTQQQIEVILHQYLDKEEGK